MRHHILQTMTFAVIALSASGAVWLAGVHADGGSWPGERPSMAVVDAGAMPVGAPDAAALETTPGAIAGPH